jgi:HEAT repeat protein
MFWVPPTLAEPIPADPVEGLRQALKAPVRDPELRDRSLRTWMERLRGLTELSQAAVLREWRDEDVDERVAAVDRGHRAVLLRRFEQAVRDVFARGDVRSQVAVADLIGYLGVQARAPGTRHSIGYPFGPDLARLVRSGEPAIRAAAAEALGRIHPDLEIALPALGSLLEAPDAAERLAATRALVSLVQVVSQLNSHSKNPAGVPATRRDVVAVSQAVVPVAGRGLRDEKPEVRRLSVAVIGSAARALSAIVLVPPGPGETGSPGASRHQLAEESAELLPLVLALKDQGPRLAQALADPDREVRGQALAALEEMAQLRWRLGQRATAVGATPTISSSSFSGEPPASADAALAGGSPLNAVEGELCVDLPPSPESRLLEGLAAAVLPLAGGLTNPDIHVRRTALDVLESLGAEAAPAAPALVHALTDPDRFVRWAAARTLGRISPVAAPATVPALARLLGDADPDVCLAAAIALETYGATAGEAVPALLQVLAGRQPTEVRLAAIRVLERIGSPGAEAAVPVLRTALADPNARVRQMAAHGLGRLGPAARTAVDALSQARTDPSPEVQGAAREALFHLLEPALPEVTTAGGKQEGHAFAIGEPTEVPLPPRR